MNLTPENFSKKILTWFAKHGRKNLPWQINRSPYRVWVSEIMLQQTQVETVIPYFKRFLKKFPTLTHLAGANIDEVLALWSGLGYYARARNLHRTAQIIQADFDGKFPEELATLQTLPGIGRSTAGAIFSLSMKRRAPILDGNVKRVLARFYAITDPINKNLAQKKLWELAERYTPLKQVTEYNQAMMDLGALICTRNQPQCPQCPLQTHCLAYANGNPTAYPVSQTRKNLPSKITHWLMLFNATGEILLEKRPPTGIWGGLWSLPECAELIALEEWCKKNYYCEIKQRQTLPAFRHTFSHFHLDITPIKIDVTAWHPPAMESSTLVWYNTEQTKKLGLAAPVKKLLVQL